MLRHGWRTAAIVPELEQETKVVCTNRYATNLTWLQALTGLMERLQVRQAFTVYISLWLHECTGEQSLLWDTVVSFS